VFVAVVVVAAAAAAAVAVAFVSFVDFKARDGKCVLFTIKLRVFVWHKRFCFKMLVRHTTLGPLFVA
jgi:hypothetical protein